MPVIASQAVDTGISKSFNFVLRASDSVRHSFNFVFDRIRSVMASANDNSTQLPADPGFLTPPSSVVTRWSFHCIPCREGLGRLVSCNELRKLEEH
jgi:hypothetical protein